MAVHNANINVSWKGSFNGGGMVRNAGFESPISLPAEFGGTGEGTTPEDLLLSSVASCYLITFGIILEKAGINYESLTMQAQLLTEVGPPAGIKEIILSPHIVTDASDETLTRLMGKISSFCLISRALDPSIKKTIQLTTGEIK